MTRQNRLFELLQILRDGQTHRAEDIARHLDVSLRTIYRDMDSLAASGVAVEGTRGRGYRIGTAVPLPPLSLTPAEIEALNLGIAIVAEAADEGLRAAAQSLADKLDAALPTEGPPAGDTWRFARTPFSDAARGFGHMQTIRAAILARQKLRIVHTLPQGTVQTATVRPLRLDHFGRIWALKAWSDSDARFTDIRLDLITSAQALPELFVDEPGKTLGDAPG